MNNILNFKDWYKVYESNGFKFDQNIAIFEGVKEDLRSIVSTIKEKDEATVKSHPEYAKVMEWFQSAGKPASRSKEASGVISTPEEMYQSMVYWQGDLTKKVESGTKLDELILKIDPWTNVEKVKANLEWLRKQDNKTTKFRPSELSNDSLYLMPDGSKIKFSRPWVKGSIDEASTLIASRVTELKNIFTNMLKNGKSPGAPVSPTDPTSTLKYTIGLLGWEKDETSTYGKQSIGGVPFGDIDVSGWEFKSLDFSASVDRTGNRRKWGHWLGTLCTGVAFEDLKKKLNSPKYILTKSIPITTDDKIKLLDLIAQKSSARKKSVTDATIIKIKPAKAIESRTVSTIKGEDKVTTSTEEINYSFPFSKDVTQAEAIAKTMFTPDSATIQDNISGQLSLAIDEMIKSIREVGELVSLEYKTIASTSDEPSKYVRPNKLGTSATREANVPLAEDRGASIENAFLALSKQKGIDSTKIIKGKAVLIPNNTMEETIVYEKMKGMRLKNGGTPQQDLEYQKLFAQPKFSGIAFKAIVNKTNTIVEPTEEKVEDYSVKGDWGISIQWSGKTKTGSSKPYRYRIKVDWNRLFPDMGSGGGGLSVKDLCAAYGG